MMNVDEEVIAEATGMTTEGMKFYRDRGILDKVADKFPITDGERRKMIKIDNSYHSPKRICRPWRFVLFASIEYITLDGRFTRAYGHHFVLLNHFHHGERVSLPYYLACSMDHTIKEIQKDPKGDHALHQGLMVLVYKMLKGKCIEKPIKGKNARDETTESKDSGFNFDSKTEGESEETSKKGRIIVESEMSDSETDSLEEKPIKKRKGKASGKKAQKKNTKKGSNSDLNYVLVESEEEDDDNKRIDSQDKEGEGNPVKDNLETVNTTGLHNEEKGSQSDSGDKDTIKAFCETITSLVKDINSLKTDT